MRQEDIIIEDYDGIEGFVGDLMGYFEECENVVDIDIYGNAQFTQDLIKELIWDGLEPIAIDYQLCERAVSVIHIYECPNTGLLSFTCEQAYYEWDGFFFGTGSDDAMCFIYQEGINQSLVDDCLKAYNYVELFGLESEDWCECCDCNCAECWDECDCEDEEQSTDLEEIEKEDDFYYSTKSVSDENGYRYISVSSTDKDYVKDVIDNFEKRRNYDLDFDFFKRYF